MQVVYHVQVRDSRQVLKSGDELSQVYLFVWRYHELFLPFSFQTILGGSMQ
jgi:hypothetical protein